jgi:hypothetical protein
MNPLHTKYKFVLLPTGVYSGLPGVQIILTNVENGKTKEFWLAGERSLAPLVAHMNSLTDEQCDSFVGIKFKGKK